MFMAVYSALLIPVLLSVLAGQPHTAAGALPAAQAPAKGFVRHYLAVFQVRPALWYLAWQVGAFSVMMVFITHGSFIYQTHFGQSADAFALLFAANIVAMFCCNLLNRWLLGRGLTSRRILQLATGLQGVGLVLLLLAALFDWSVWLFLPAMMMTIGAHGALSPNLQACYMEHFPRNGGSAAALLGACQFGGAGVLSGLSGLLPHTLLVVVLAMLACGALAQCCLWHSLLIGRQGLSGPGSNR